MSGIKKQPKQDTHKRQECCIHFHGPPSGFVVFRTWSTTWILGATAGCSWPILGLRLKYLLALGWFFQDDLDVEAQQFSVSNKGWRCVQINEINHAHKFIYQFPYSKPLNTFEQDTHWWRSLEHLHGTPTCHIAVFFGSAELFNPNTECILDRPKIIQDAITYKVDIVFFCVVHHEHLQYVNHVCVWWIFFKATNMVTPYSIQQSCLNEFKNVWTVGFSFWCDRSQNSTYMFWVKKE